MIKSNKVIIQNYLWPQLIFFLNLFNISPNVLIAYKCQKYSCSSCFPAASSDCRMNVNQRYDEIPNNKNKMDSSVESRNVFAPNNYGKEEEFRYRCEHKSTKEIGSET